MIGALYLTWAGFLGWLLYCPFNNLITSRAKGAILLKHMAYTGHRSWHVGPWHNCARCDDKKHISELQWQRGLLLCTTGNKCYDTGNDGYPLVGQREMAIASYLEHQTEELQPDPKLTDNNQIEGSMDEDLIV